MSRPSAAMTLNRLPDEVVLQILSYLSTEDLVRLQTLSSRYLSLSRDNSLARENCFNHSTAEALRLRQIRLNIQGPRLTELRNAVAALPGDDSQLFGRAPERASTDPAAEARLQRARALANWEPAYPDESLDYYEEFIHRHAPIDVGWLNAPKGQSSDKDELREATGVGILSDQQDGAAKRAIAPLDDGSVCIWDLSATRTYRSGGGGRLLGQSRSGLLSGRPPDATSESHAIMTETGAVECVSIDSSSHKGYFAVQNLLQEVDLSTLQLTSTKAYPFPITALSDTKDRAPITVGTNMTIHLHDPRDPAFTTSEASPSGELIGGSIYSHATLAQPGPLSILNHSGISESDSSIWVAGRFTSLLNYDRRFFPRLRGTIFSGARIASLSAFPHPFIPRDCDLQRKPHATISSRQAVKSGTGSTILAAAEYKGKGSLELYGLPGTPQHPQRQDFYHNRQTASASKLLSVAPHGGRIVFSDGDGNLKWVERDGFSSVRTFNISDVSASALPQDRPPDTAGIWSSTGSEMPGQGDIVQKITPVTFGETSLGSSAGRLDINQSDLLLWTGDGRLGLLGFGRRNPLGDEQWHDALEEQALTAEQRARQDAERQYGMAMRRALERNADEVRFVRGLGMGP